MLEYSAYGTNYRLWWAITASEDAGLRVVSHQYSVLYRVKYRVFYSFAVNKIIRNLELKPISNFTIPWPDEASANTPHNYRCRIDKTRTSATRPKLANIDEHAPISHQPHADLRNY
jgi:hypothetical protein